VQSAAFDKVNGNSFGGNSFTDHGKLREPEIAGWVSREYGIQSNTTLFHADDQLLHLATPDGIAVNEAGETELAEIKTTNKAWRSIPRNYLRQGGGNNTFLEPAHAPGVRTFRVLSRSTPNPNVAGSIATITDHHSCA
jgi:hypothetical protein